jgi:hypothetical protein
MKYYSGNVSKMLFMVASPRAGQTKLFAFDNRIEATTKQFTPYAVPHNHLRYWALFIGTSSAYPAKAGTVTRKYHAGNCKIFLSFFPGKKESLRGRT